MLSASTFIRNINLITFAPGPGTSDRIKNQVCGLKERVFVASIVKANKNFFKPQVTICKPTIFGLGLGPLCPSFFRKDNTRNSSSFGEAKADFNEENLTEPQENKPEPKIYPKRTPKNSLKDVIYHATYMSLVLSDLSPSETDTEVVFELLLHLIALLDNALSGEFEDTCFHVLIGIKQVMKWIQEGLIIRNSTTQQPFRPTGLTSFVPNPTSRKITELIDQLRNEKAKPKFNLKSAFLRLQLQLISLIEHGRPTVFNPNKGTLENILNEIDVIFSILKSNHQSLKNLQWENNDDVRTEYWSLFIDTLYPTVQAEYQDFIFKSEKTKTEEFVGDEPKKPFDFGKEFEEELRKKKKPTEGSKSAKFEETDYIPKSHGSNSPKIITRKCRGGIDLILDLGNHILQLNNLKFGFLGLNHRNCESRELKTRLYDMLTHQIATLDLVLSLGLWDTASLMIFGMRDTVYSICTNFELNSTSESLKQLPAQASTPLYEKFRKAISLCHEAITEIQCESTVASRIKMELIKVQLEALLVVSSFGVVPEEQLAPDLEQLCKTLSKVNTLLQNKWWLRFFQLGWDCCAATTSSKSDNDNGIGTEAEACKEYWDLMDDFYKDTCGAH